jgi:hypothetical protein
VKVLVINDPDIGKCIENNENKSLHLSQFKWGLLYLEKIYQDLDLYEL